jgi:poly(3-hydroxybutyrate) depolymerase
VERLAAQVRETLPRLFAERSIEGHERRTAPVPDMSARDVLLSFSLIVRAPSGAAVFGQTAAAKTQQEAVTSTRARELALSELEVMTVLEIVTSEYGADRSRTYLAGHSMGSGGVWHLAARYPERWRASRRSPGLVDETTYPFDACRF